MENKNINEIRPDNLDQVNGGTSPLFPEAGHPASDRPFDLHGDVTGMQTESLPQMFAYCKLCGSQVIYLGQTRIGGGNTGEYKCTNAACGNFNKIIYNDGVDIP